MSLDHETQAFMLGLALGGLIAGLVMVVGYLESRR